MRKKITYTFITTSTFLFGSLVFSLRVETLMFYFRILVCLIVLLWADISVMGSSNTKIGYILNGLGYVDIYVNKGIIGLSLCISMILYNPWEPIKSRSRILFKSI